MSNAIREKLRCELVRADGVSIETLSFSVPAQTSLRRSRERLGGEVGHDVGEIQRGIDRRDVGYALAPRNRAVAREVQPQHDLGEELERFIVRRRLVSWSRVGS